VQKLHNEKRNYRYSSLNISRGIKWKRVRWAGHVALMGKTRGAYRILVRETGRKNHVEDAGVEEV
jgi:hypothetical protein